ncbi:MAG: glycoside hydrolase family 2 TIM barrel-domain containing protein, partial [Bacteroides sp.]|nr:glycoside hydrolase family 2 TIM barrel-domain containing protein [Bacteroides sp.]
MRPVKIKCLQTSLIILLAVPFVLSAQNTEIFHLSGSGFDQTIQWDFLCSDGMKSGEWTTIEVPSCWEQQGFGQYNYGHDAFDERFKEEGHYKHFFDVDKSWKGQVVNLLFEGVMTDARVLVNGKQAGEVHQGAFNPFSYDISKLLKYGKENKLEVFVKKFSDNMTVNQAERKADYWIFGGIYRPVYLEIKPAEHIKRVAVDARADGSFQADVYTSGIKTTRSIKVDIRDVTGNKMAAFDFPLSGDVAKHNVSGAMSNILTWTPENPNLYTAEFSLLDEKGETIHSLSEKIGFRTVEVRAQDGIYVNNVRIKYKGVCRHTFHPDHGRTSSKAFSIEVVNLLKDMNMNAVRMSHYAPDSHFLDVCDSLGLFVLDELAGWQAPSYDSVVGRKLLKEMIARDVNHPSIIMWDNANEGGWNTVYDKDFKKLDIQQREVNHPWAVHELTNTAHYVNYDYLSMDNFAPREIFFPTELLHGLYDGGHGAGLEDYWFRMWDHPLCAGGFLWVFADEAVKRSDTGELDSDGNHAPDGILGPYHEKEGSFYAIREIWSPVYFEKRYITPQFNGQFRIQNRYHYTDLDQCAFSYQWINLPDPQGLDNIVLKEGIPIVDPLTPGQSGTLSVPLDKQWMQADVLIVEAHDPKGRLINQWSWPVKSPEKSTTELLQRDVSIQVMVTVSETDQDLIL